VKAKPCKHSRRALVLFEAVKLRLDDDGKVAAWGDTPEMNLWGVIEHRRCAKCGDVGMYFARKGFGETTERKALARYGVKPAALPAPPNHRETTYKVPPQEGLWPFPSIERPLVPLTTKGASS
jgi:hypothetical protein